MGLWNMLTQANETKRHTQSRREKPRKFVESVGGRTVAIAVVFHWRLERVGVHLELGSMCGHMITRPRYEEVNGSLLLWKKDFSSCQVSPNMTPTVRLMHFTHLM